MDEVPQYYSDGIEINLVMPWTVGLKFSLKSLEGEKKEIPQVVVRMSPEHAKTLAMLLRRLLKTYEYEQKSIINLPTEMYSKLGLPPEDWGD